MLIEFNISESFYKSINMYRNKIQLKSNLYLDNAVHHCNQSQILRMLRQENHKFYVCLGFRVNSRPVKVGYRYYVYI